MYYEVTKSLEMNAMVDTYEVSQAVEMGSDNAVAAQVWVVSGSLYPLGNALTVTLEGSDDLDQWSPASYSPSPTTIEESPSFTPITLYGSPFRVPFRYVRLKYRIAPSGEVLFGASIKTLTWG